MLQAQSIHREHDEFIDVIHEERGADAYDSEKDFEDFLNSKYFLQVDIKQRAVDLEAMQEIATRVRKQVRCIIRSLRHWQESHAEFDNNTRLRYSAYEGALCYSDLRRHWAYYRHVMRELRGMMGMH